MSLDPLHHQLASALKQLGSHGVFDSSQLARPYSKDAIARMEYANDSLQAYNEAVEAERIVQTIETEEEENEI